MYMWVSSFCFKQKNKTVIIKLSFLPALSNFQNGLTV